MCQSEWIVIGIPVYLHYVLVVPFGLVASIPDLACLVLDEETAARGAFLREAD
jgi:hypothetical protein